MHFVFSPHHPINSVNFEKDIERKMCVLIFCTTCVLNIRHSEK